MSEFELEGDGDEGGDITLVKALMARVEGALGTSRGSLVSCAERLSRLDTTSGVRRLRRLLPPGLLRGAVNVEVVADCKRRDVGEEQWQELRDGGVPVDILISAMEARGVRGRLPTRAR